MNKLHQNLTAVFRFAVKKRWLAASPMALVDHTKERKDDQHVPRVLKAHDPRLAA